MKKSIILALLLCFVLAVPAIAAPDVMLDGEPVYFTDAAPTIENGRTLVPLRAIFEAMGAEVFWDSNKNTATAIKANTKVVLPIGSTQPTINGSVQQLDVPAKIINGRTLAPLRFVGEVFGGNVRWDQGTQTIYITSPDASLKLSSTQKIFVHFIDVGQADAIYISLPDDQDILIDAGNRADGSTVVRYLRNQGVDDIELLIATHPHEDHIGGIPDVLNMFEIENIIDSGYPANTAAFNTYFTSVQAEGAKYAQAAYQSFNYGNATLKILTGHEYWEEVNNYSVVCRLDTGDIEFLFMGDAESPVESNLYGDISAEILKVGHHGSNTGSTQSFLDKVYPQSAIISVGVGNDYGHPSDGVLTRLQSAGAKSYRTDKQGTIIVTTDGSSFNINSSPSSQTGDPVITPVKNIGDSGQYIGNKNSKKFHRSSCSYLPKPTNQILFDTRNEAVEAGFEPCQMCKP